MKIDDLVKSLLGRHPGEIRGPEIYESGFLFSQETLDSGACPGPDPGFAGMTD